MTIGSKIKHFRTILGLSQAELARMAKVSQPVIAELEKENQQTSKKLPAIASALGVRISDLDAQYESMDLPDSVPQAAVAHVPVRGSAEAVLLAQDMLVNFNK